MATRLSDLQLELMDALWSLEEASTAEIHSAFGAPRDLAYTTVATLLKRLDEKGVIAHRKEGRQHVYRPLVERDEVAQSLVSGLVQRIFRGDPAALVSQLLGSEDIDAEDVARIKSLIDHHEEESS